MESCVYLKPDPVLGQEEDGHPVYGCDIHSKCTDHGEHGLFMSCQNCPDKLLQSQSDFNALFLDPLKVLDRTKKETHALRNLLAGQPTFLVCGGPSAKSLPLDQLNRRGLWSIAVNNMAGFFWPSAFICADPPSKFHHGIWLDPQVMKFVPIPKLSGRRSNLREKVGDEFKPLQIDGKDISVNECPNIWGFSRRSWLIPDDTFFTDHDAAWGNHNSGQKRTGLKKTVMTLLLAMRILYYLGSRRIFLVGVDFQMDPGAGLTENYAFGEHREADAIQSNNTQFGVVNEWLTTMVENGTFKKFGLEIFNTNPLSGLRAFHHVPFEEAIKSILRNFPVEPFSLDGWYKK